MSKLLEKVVLHKRLSHLQENNLSNPFQTAYRAGHSTETVLLCIVNDILSALTMTFLFFSCWIFLQLLKLLTTNSPLPLNSVFGIQPTALQWFQSYLSDRYQSTSVNNSSSSPSQLMYSWLSTRARSLRPVHCTTVRYDSLYPFCKPSAFRR